MTRELAGRRFQPGRDRDIEDALSGNDPKVLNEWAFYYFNTDQYEEAIECWLKISEIDAGFPAVHFNLGSAFLRVGLVPEALREFGLAAERDPGDPEIAYQTAITLNLLDRNDEALDALARAVSLKADYADAHLLRGSILAKMGPGGGRWPAAADAFEMYLRCQPDADNADALGEFIERLRSGG